MLDWDLKFIALAEESKLTTYMYKRFVDDTANAMEAISPGTRWGEEEGRMVMLPHLVNEDMSDGFSTKHFLRSSRSWEGMRPMVSPSSCLACHQLGSEELTT